MIAKRVENEVGKSSSDEIQDHEKYRRSCDWSLASPSCRLLERLGDVKNTKGEEVTFLFRRRR